MLNNYKTISALSRSTSAVGTNYNGGPALMDVDNIWKKEEATKAKERTRDATKEAKAKAMTGAKVTTKGLTKATIRNLQRRRVQ